MAIVGMAPAKDEMLSGIPFTGPSGKLLNDALAQLGISRNDVYVTNVHDDYLAPGLSLFSLPAEVRHRSLARLKHELSGLPNLNVCVPLGDEPLQLITGLNGITKWRGSIVSSSLVPGLKCVPSVHTAWIVRGMWKWLPVFTHIDLKRAKEESTFKELVLPRRDAITGPSFSTTMDYIEECYKHEYLSNDIETFGFSKSGMGEIACIGIGFDPSKALCIPFVRSGGSPYWTVNEEAAIWKALARLFQATRATTTQKNERKLVGQNLGFEWIYYWYHKIFPPAPYIDTMLLHHCLYPDWGAAEDPWGTKRVFEEPGHSLAFINSQYTKTPYYKDDGKRWTPGIGDHAFWTYNCKDVMVTLDSAIQMEQEAREEGLWDFFVEFYIRPFLHFVRMEWFGVGIDVSRRDEIGNDLLRQIKLLQDRIDEKLGYHLNVNSSPQMKKFLYEQRGFKPEINRKTKKVTADKRAVQKFFDQSQDEVLLWIQELRAVRDLKGDIIDQKLGDDNRMHTHWKQGGTDTNRRASSRSILGTGTNFQNIPVKGPARKLFIPD